MSPRFCETSRLLALQMLWHMSTLPGTMHVICSPAWCDIPLLSILLHLQLHGIGGRWNNFQLFLPCLCCFWEDLMQIRINTMKSYMGQLTWRPLKTSQVGIRVWEHSEGCLIWETNTEMSRLEHYEMKGVLKSFHWQHLIKNQRLQGTEMSCETTVWEVIRKFLLTFLLLLFDSISFE